MAAKQEKITPEQLQRSIEDSFKKNILPWWREIERRTVRAGRNSRIVYL